MSTIYLIRHGEICTNSGEHRFIGRLDLPLSERGHAQIHRLASYPALQGIDRILTSPLLRCRESAAILSTSLGCESAEVVPEFSEIDLGEWDGMTVSEVTSRFPDAYVARGNDLAGFRPAGGESFDDLLQRSWPAFAQIAHCGVERVAIVAHAGINRVLLCKILGIPLANLFRLRQDYGCCNILHNNGSHFLVDCINGTCLNL